MFEQELAELGVELHRPSFKREKQRYGEPILKKARQLIESVNDTPGIRHTTRSVNPHPLADRV